MRRFAGALAAGFTAAACLITAAPLPVAHAATSVSFRGTVECQNGNSVVGIWVESSGGGSRFTDTLTRYPGNGSVAYYTVKLSSSATTPKISLHVGCGGTAGKWGSDNWTPAQPVAATMNARCTEKLNVAGGVRCSWPSLGVTVASGNGGYNSPQCTWGAMGQVMQRIGKAMELHYWGGVWHSADAKYWNDNAAKTGWTVVSQPRARAVVVYEAGTSVKEPNKSAWTMGASGHVAFVMDVRFHDGAVWIVTADTNWPSGSASYVQHEVKHTTRMSYILIP